ncbi:putative nwd2 protein [Mycena venus]|uniref:Putative nwd2 protein n=1 Tax=Mycena venus TaxID=2733690 RepID=A0A8H6X9B8_9AGAR|nr:putative nwd2 protein [Mycena venus]
MPFFNSSSNIQIDGGGFSRTEDDMNLESSLQAALGQGSDLLTGLKLGWLWGPERQLLGAERNVVQMPPYDISCGPHPQGPTLRLSSRDDRPSNTSFNSGLFSSSSPFDPSNMPSSQDRSTLHRLEYRVATSEYSTDPEQFSTPFLNNQQQLSALVPLRLPDIPSHQPEATSLNRQPSLDLPSAAGNESGVDPASRVAHPFSADVDESPLGSNIVVINHQGLPRDLRDGDGHAEPRTWPSPGSAVNRTLDPLDMLRRAGVSQTVNINGGVGGTGGEGGTQGGGGGTGMGPTINYDISGVDNFTMNVNHIQCQGMGLKILHRVAACDALHNSADRYPQPRCHPDTRTKLLDHLWDWTRGIERPRDFMFEDYDDWSWRRHNNWYHDGQDSCRMNDLLWLHGPAGAGKSAIAQSLCQRLETEDCVAASFFFKRGHASRGNATRLFSTIAYQLAVRLGQSDCIICQNVGKDPSIVDKSFPIQLQKLIVEPCQKIPLSRPVIIIIDGLDECDGENIQQEILNSIGNAISGERLPLRFLIASRPELHLRDIFVGPCLSKYHRPLNINQSFEDIRTYLVDEFTRIYADHHETMAAIPRPWPAVNVVESLVDKSSGYFIYASTVIKFIDDKYFRPTERLEIIMGTVEPNSETPFSALDQLYTQILIHVPQAIQPRLLRILTVYATKWNLKVPHIEQLLEIKPGDVHLTLRGLHSIIKVDGDYIIADHASFLDFLTSSTRSGMFYVGPQQRTDLASQILKAFSYKYDDPLLNRIGPVAL